MEDVSEAKSAALQAHCRRVAAWALEMGSALQLSRQDLAILAAAANRHHTPGLIEDEAVLSRLLGDLHVASPKSATEPQPSTRPSTRDAIIEQVLSAAEFPDASRFNEHVLLLARILDLANYFDEHLEMAPLEGRNLDHVFEEVLASAKDGLFDGKLVLALSSLRKVHRDEVLELIPKLPVYPAVAIRATAVAANPNVSLVELEQICMQDQVLTGQVLQAANSALYSPRFPVTTVIQAANLIGLEATRRIFATAAIRPLFASSRLRALWKHSVECAGLAETIAQLAGTIDPKEAFVAGLLHDIGRLAFSLLRRDVGEACDRLTSAGCEPLLAELVLTGFDHAEAGAEILSRWKLPEGLVDGVRHHHQPEDARTAMAAVLYLTEFWAAGEEDLPSNRLLSYSLKRLNISPKRLDSANLAGLSTLHTVLC